MTVIFYSCEAVDALKKSVQIEKLTPAYIFLSSLCHNPRKASNIEPIRNWRLYVAKGNRNRWKRNSDSETIAGFHDRT